MKSKKRKLMSRFNARFTTSKTAVYAMFNSVEILTQQKKKPFRCVHTAKKSKPARKHVQTERQ